MKSVMWAIWNGLALYGLFILGTQIYWVLDFKWNLWNLL